MSKSAMKLKTINIPPHLFKKPNSPPPLQSIPSVFPVKNILKILKIYKIWVHLFHEGRDSSVKFSCLSFCRLPSLLRDVINSFATCKR